jgi:hypothetical protein
VHIYDIEEHEEKARMEWRMIHDGTRWLVDEVRSQPQ